MKLHPTATAGLLTGAALLLCLTLVSCGDDDAGGGVSVDASVADTIDLDTAADADPDSGGQADAADAGGKDSASEDGTEADAEADAGIDARLDAAEDSESDAQADALADGGPVSTEPERCHGGIDEDGDGATDCDDSQCAGYEHCHPDGCSNGIDDDGDGRIDCGDPNCLTDEPCNVENGILLVFCQVEKGCHCEIGVDCPDDQEAWNQCQSVCQNDLFCPGQCLDTMPVEVLNEYYTYIGCYQDSCGNVTTVEESNACFYEYCYDEYVDWLLSDELDCIEYQECADTCQDGAACGSYCYGRMTKESLTDLTGYSDCQLELCDPDGDGEAPNQLCLAMGFWACMQQGATCFELESLVSGESCGQVMDCVVDCAGLPIGEIGTCIFACAEYLDQSHLDGLASLTECLIGACDADILTLACMAAARTNECAGEYAQCGGDVVLTEDCTDGIDNDFDELVDCDDPDCAEDPACPVDIVVCVVDTTESPTCSAEQAESPGVDIDAIAFSSAGTQFIWPTQWYAGPIDEPYPLWCESNPHAPTLEAVQAIDGDFASLNGQPWCAVLSIPNGASGSILVVESGDASLEPYAVTLRFATQSSPGQSLGQGLGTTSFPWSWPIQ